MPSHLSAPLVMLVLVLVVLWVLVPSAADRCPPPGQNLACPNTCCPTDSKQRPFVCCPYRDGVCCADGRHCCRKGFTCDPVNPGRCLRTAPVRGLCPDGKSRCPPGATCCQLENRRWGCCPYHNAVCCPDRVHCCPEGTRCDLQTLTCVTKSDHPMLELSGKPQLEMLRKHVGLEA